MACGTVLGANPELGQRVWFPRISFRLYFIPCDWEEDCWLECHNVDVGGLTAVGSNPRVLLWETEEEKQ